MDKIFCHANSFGLNYGILILGNGCARLFKYYRAISLTSDPEYTCTIPVSMLEKSLGFLIVAGISISKEKHLDMEAAYKEYNPMDVPSYI